MYVKVFVTIILSVQTVQKTNAFGVRITNDALTKMHTHLHFRMVSAENGQQMSTVVELHLVSNLLLMLMTKFPDIIVLRLEIGISILTSNV